MKPNLIRSLTVVLILVAAAGLRAEPRLGADLSFVPRLESCGVDYRRAGLPDDVLRILRSAGCDLVRLRLWHDPAEPWHGTAATLAYAERVAAAGLDLMLDFHYSDTWADPGRQTNPTAWRDLDFAALVDSVYAYSRDTVARFADAGLAPRYVQVGNEIGPGLLWDDGRVGWSGSPFDTPRQWSQLSALLQAGISGVRDACPGTVPQIVIHVADGGDNATCRWFFDGLLAHDVVFDIIGVSYYPWWHGRLQDLATNLDDLVARYGKPVFVVETAYPWTLENGDPTNNFVWNTDQLPDAYAATPDGQRRFLGDLCAVVRDANAAVDDDGAVLYWEPAFVPVRGGPDNPHDNLTLFDFSGEALPGLDFGLTARGDGNR